MPAASTRAAVAAVAFLTRIPVGRARCARRRRRRPRGRAVPGRRRGGRRARRPRCGRPRGSAARARAAGGRAVAVAALLTGALHLDALADTADALGARTARARSRSCGTPDRYVRRRRARGRPARRGGRAGALAPLADAVAGFATAGALSRAVRLRSRAALPYARAEGRARERADRPRVGCGAVVDAPRRRAALRSLGWDGSSSPDRCAALATIAAVGLAAGSAA